jgi:hypothetical protein
LPAEAFDGFAQPRDGAGAEDDFLSQAGVAELSHLTNCLFFILLVALKNHAIEGPPSEE